MRIRKALYGYDAKSVKEAMLVMEQSHLRNKDALTGKLEALKEERLQLEAELAARRAAANIMSETTAEGGERDG